MRYIRNSGLVALVLMSLTAIIGASSASATVLGSEAFQTNFTGSSPSGQFQFGPEQPRYGCTGTSISGTQEGTQIRTLEVTPEGGSCSWAGTLPIQWKGCHITFHVGLENSGTVDLGPGTCGPVTLERANECELTVPPQMGIPAHFHGSGTGTGRTVEVTTSTTHLKYARTGGLCGKKGTGEDGTWSATWVLKGSIPGSGGQEVGIYLEPTQGIEIAGGQFRYGTSTVIGGVSTVNSFMEDVEGIRANCGNGSLGPATVAFPSASLGIGVSYGGCSSVIGSATVNMQNCNYVFHVTNTTAPFVGNVELACSNEGESMETRFYDTEGSLICRTFFQPQILGAVTYETVGSGESRKVIANVNGKGLKGTREGSALCGPATSTKGIFTGSFFLANS